MTKRKGKVARSGTLTPVEQRDGDARGEITDCKEGKGFFACYLLTSLSPRYKGHTYIGFTVNPRRRIRQHNGEIRSGAVRTKSRRPWDMVLCIYGFPTNVDALQFEWAWQHPTESLAVRKAAASFKSLSGIANKIKLAYTMLTLHSWQSMDLTVNFFSTKYVKYAADCPSLPKQMKVQIGYMDELICYSGIDQCAHVDEDDWDDGQGLSQMGTIGESSGEELVAVVDHSSVYLDGCTAVEMDVQMEFQENCLAEARDFFSPPDDYTELLCRIVSMDGKISSSGTNTFSKISAPEKAKNTDSYITVEEITDQSQEELPTIGVTDIMQPFSCGMVEVIDLFTPSPECCTKACSKKRRVSSSFPEIIDLTKSPVFVQL